MLLKPSRSVTHGTYVCIKAVFFLIPPFITELWAFCFCFKLMFTSNNCFAWRLQFYHWLVVLLCLRVLTGRWFDKCACLSSINIYLHILSALYFVTCSYIALYRSLGLLNKPSSNITQKRWHDTGWHATMHVSNQF